MNLESLLRQFDVISDAPNGPERLRELILELAVRGRLVPQDASEEPASALIEAVMSRRSGVNALPLLNTGLESAGDDLPFPTPAGWEWLRLGDAGQFIGGGTPSKAESSFWDGDVPWVSPKDMKRLRISDSADHISIEAVARSAVRLIPPGALLVVVRGMILARAFPVAVTTREVTVNQDMKALSLYDPRMAEFMLLALRAWRSRVLPRVERSTHGTCRLDSTVLQELLLPVPPLAEQHRIIAKVDELMALCDALEARQRRRAETRARLNQSVLHRLSSAENPDALAAQWPRLRDSFDLLYDTPETVADLRLLFVDLGVRGRLLPPTKAVAGSNSVEDLDGVTDSLPALPDSWRWERIGSLGADPTNAVQTGPFGAQLHKTEFVDAGVPVIAVGNLTGRGFKTEGLYFVTHEKATALARYDVKSGDLLFARSGATLGKVCVAPDFVDDWRMTGHILRARLDPALANPHFVVYALWGAQIVREQVMGGVQGSTRPGYNTSLLERILLPVPPRAEQDRIVAKLDELMSLCDRLEEQLSNARDQSDRLAAAVVHLFSAA